MYMSMMKRRVRKVERALKDHGIEFETHGDDVTFVISPTATILTPNCTIELYKNEIAVNEVPTTLDDFICEVLAVENPA